MTLNVEKILSDARTMVGRLREHDSVADTLIAQATALHRRVDAMRQVRDLQQENKELRLSLEEHQSAMELIMSKYREQVHKLMMANKTDRESAPENHTQELQDKISKLNEMVTVMQAAISIDDEHYAKDQERIAQLRMENRTLRDLLKAAAMNTPCDCSTEREKAPPTATDSVTSDSVMSESVTSQEPESPNAHMNFQYSAPAEEVAAKLAGVSISGPTAKEEDQ